MASVSSDRNGNRRVLFTNRDGQRKTVYLGTMPKKQADTVCTKIEALNAATITGVAPADEVTRWVADIGDDLHKKLAKVGLVEPRGNVKEITLAEFIDQFIDQFIAGRVDVKPGTVTNYRICQAKLVAYFKSTKRLGDVTPLDTDRFRSWLKAGARTDNAKAKGDEAKAPLSENYTRTLVKNAKLIFGARGG